MMDFPKPEFDTGIGVHDDANCYWKPPDMYEYARWLREHGITWYLLFVGDENKADYCRALVDAGIMPIVRFWPAKMPRPNIDQGHVDAYLAADAQWFVLGNEFNLDAEWTGERPQDGPEKCADWYARVASEIRAKGGWPLTPPPSLGGNVNHRIWFTRFLQRLVELGFDLEPGGVGLHCRSVGNPLEDGPEDYDCSAREWEWFDATIKELTGSTVPMANLEAFDEPNWSKRLHPEFSPEQKWDWWRERNLTQMRWFDPNNAGYKYPPRVFANCFWILHDGGTWNDCGLLDNYYYDKETGRGRETDLWKQMPGTITWEREEQLPLPPYSLKAGLTKWLGDDGWADMRAEIRTLSTDEQWASVDTRDFGQIDSIILHHSGSNEPQTIEGIAKYHIGKGWGTISYHFILAGDKVFFTAPIKKVTHHAGDKQNPNSIGICVLGDYTEIQLTDGQIEILRNLIHALEEFQGQAWDTKRRLYTLTHGHVWTTACPGSIRSDFVWRQLW